ncbi:trimeric intracellular cation channel type A [Genypterus blacodes]|uniref:trimeric intracellular cation channel type A n=1 Tax=Genypterus blacodes TaxID=154954 RepID=UPI003F757FAB
MEVLSALNLGDYAQAFSKMGMFPVFDLAYYIVSILYLKYEPGSVEVSRRSPVASWLCAMLYCFGSYILADIMLGSSPLDYFQHNSHILLASAVWYLIFYCPLNLFYKCVSFLPVKLVFVGLKEVVRCRKIAAGVHHAHHAYHHGFFIMVLVGYVKGSGVALISNFEQLLRGVWRPETNELLNMSFPTKASLYGAILFTLQESHILPVSKSTLILVFTLFMITCKVWMTARHSHGSPFALIESWVCHVLFGSALGGGEDDHHHTAPAAAAPSSPPKTKEELSEGVRKRKAKKAE